MTPPDLSADLVVRIHPDDLASLKALVRRTRVRQSEYLREAIADLLQRGPRARALRPTGQGTRSSTWRPVHLQLSPKQMLAFGQLSHDTRIPQVELMAEALGDLIAKYPRTP